MIGPQALKIPILICAILCHPASANADDEIADPATTISANENDRAKGAMVAASDVEIFDQYTNSREAERLNKLIDAVFQEIFQPGEIIKGWDQLGTNMISEFAPVNDDKEPFLLEQRQGSYIDFIDFSGELRPDLSGYHSVELRPDPEGGANMRIFHSISTLSWIETAHQFEISGNALCNQGKYGIRLHTLAPLSQMPKLILSQLFAAKTAAERINERRFCTIYQMIGDGEYNKLYFLPNGAELADYDSSELISTRVPASQLDRILQGDYSQP